MKYIEFLKARNEVNIEMLESSSNLKEARSRKVDRKVRDSNDTELQGNNILSNLNVIFR